MCVNMTEHMHRYMIYDESSSLASVVESFTSAVMCIAAGFVGEDVKA